MVGMGAGIFNFLSLMLTIITPFYFLLYGLSFDSYDKHFGKYVAKLHMPLSLLSEPVDGI